MISPLLTHNFYKMHTPTKAQWQTVIDNFKKVLPLAEREDQFDMREPAVRSDEHKCGTVHCMGGWYAIKFLDEIVKQCKPGQFIGYNEGANLIAEHLGFPGQWDLQEWAGDNPEIWGNEEGSSMFSNEDSYGGAKTLAEAVTWLEGVRDRSPD
jgi:hypothetical protein